MTVELKLEGKWWLPENPEKIIIGTLTISPDNNLILDIRYESELNFSDMERARLRTIHEETAFGLNPEIIIGETFHDSQYHNRITLLKCYKKFESLSDSICKATYEVQHVFRGFHFLKMEDIKFDTLSIEFSGLHDWLKISVFDDSYDPEIKKNVLKYKRWEEIPLIKTPQCEISIEISVKTPKPISTRSFTKKELCYKQKSKLKLYFVNSNLFEDCLKLAFHLRDFLNLMVFEPIRIISMFGTIDTPKQFYPINFGEIFSRTSISEKHSAILKKYEILLPYDYIKDKITELLQNWLRKADDLHPICDFYFDSFRNPNIMRESTFLSLVIAFESYLSNLAHLEDVESGNAILKKIREEIIQACQDRKAIIREKFKIYTPLREKFEELLVKLKPVSEKIIPEVEQENFLSKVVNTRNYLTHHSKNLEKKIAKGRELVKIIHQLRLLLNICLLQELGLKLEEIERLTEESFRYKVELKKIKLIEQGKFRTV